MHAIEASSRLTTRRVDPPVTVMEARGVGWSISRSCAPEGALVGLSFAIALTAVGTSVLTGRWNFLAGA